MRIPNARRNRVHQTGDHHIEGMREPEAYVQVVQADDDLGHTLYRQDFGQAFHGGGGFEQQNARCASSNHFDESGDLARAGEIWQHEYACAQSEGLLHFRPRSVMQRIQPCEDLRPCDTRGDDG